MGNGFGTKAHTEIEALRLSDAGDGRYEILKRMRK